jgi:hypothetical protein
MDEGAMKPITAHVVNAPSEGIAEVLARLLLDLDATALTVVSGTIDADEQDRHLCPEQQRPLRHQHRRPTEGAD